jgi:hypothetical protein
VGSAAHSDGHRAKEKVPTILYPPRPDSRSL